MRELINQSRRTKRRKPNRISNILVSTLLFLLIASCTPTSSTAISVDSQSTKISNGVPVTNPTNSPTLLPVTAESSPTGVDTPSPAPSSPGSNSTQPAISLTFLPVADAYVKKSQPDSNFGNVTDLNVDSGSDSVESFVRFTIMDVSGTVQDARLRLYTKENGSLDGPAVYSTNETWAEAELTWNNRPTHNRALDNKDQIDSETWVEYNVTSAVKGQGTVSFIIAADNGDAIVFASREDTHPPELVVTYVPAGPVPTATLSAEDVTFVGAGDIATCTNDNDELTA